MCGGLPLHTCARPPATPCRVQVYIYIYTSIYIYTYSSFGFGKALHTPLDVCSTRSCVYMYIDLHMCVISASHKQAPRAPRRRRRCPAPEPSPFRCRDRARHGCIRLTCIATCIYVSISISFMCMCTVPCQYTRPCSRQGRASRKTESTGVFLCAYCWLVVSMSIFVLHASSLREGRAADR